MRILQAIVTGLFFSFLIQAQSGGSAIPEHVPGRLIVQHVVSGSDSRVQQAFARHGAQVHMRLEGLSATVIDVAPGTEETVRQALLRNPLFRAVEYDYYAHAGGTPNDPDLGSQWYLSRIQALTAWNTGTGSGTPVAVIDSGVDGSHPDLAGRLMAGWNFVTGSSNTNDTSGHGTAVTGVIGGIANNGIGIAGVTWQNPILPLVAVDSSGYAAYSNIAAAIQYAADHGARVISVSLGGSAASSVLQSAVDYAWNRNAIVVAAAMNNSSTTPMYPAACANVLAVSATDVNDTFASFSNYGNWIALSAPGNNILTTVQGGGYGYWYGTSFSSPIAAGVAALALAVNPSLTNSALATLLEQNSDQVGGAGYSTHFGYGRVNAYRAVTAAQNLLAPATISISPAAVTLQGGQAQQFNPTITGGSGNLTLTWSMNPPTGTLANGLYTAPAAVSTSQTVTITATLPSGAHATASVTLAPPATNTSTGSSGPSNFSPIRVDAGGAAYTDSSGNTWGSDYDYIGGYTASSGSTVSGTTAPTVYQSCRWGAFTYQFAVPNGGYTVVLKFAEIYFTTPGSRMFNVSINGTPVLANFDVVAQAGGALKALDKSFPVTVTNGQIRIQFTPGSADQPLVNGIEIDAGSTTSTGTSATTTSTTTAATAVFRVDAGGPAYTDPSGNTWGADTSFAGGFTALTYAMVSGTTAPALYQTCRWGSFSYPVSVPNGNYTVNLKFAEIYFTTPGSRIFNVTINGTPVLANFDIVAQAGGTLKALDKSFPVTVTNGLINIQFTPGAADQPLVNAIEILTAP